MSADSRCETHDLLTIRDWLRFAITRFRAAQLSYGHGTANAVDEAAFIILAAFNLPIQSIEPWLECRLTQGERLRIRELIEARVSTRKPAAYLLHEAWIGDCRFYVDERVIVPRSYIGELLAQSGLSAIVPDPDEIRSVLDLCTGSGSLAILAAAAFPYSRVTASDISQDALAVARRNIDDYALAARIDIAQGDLFVDLGSARFDLIISNPPYVRTQAVEEFPAEYAAEPRLAHDGGRDGLALVRRILSESSRYLTNNGVLVVEVGDERAALEAEFSHLPFLWLETETSEGEVFALSAGDLKLAGTAEPRGSRRKKS